MSPLETLELDYKTKGYLDLEKLFKVLREQAAKIKALEEHPAVSIPPVVPYTNPESH